MMKEEKKMMDDELAYYSYSKVGVSFSSFLREKDSKFLPRRAAKPELVAMALGPCTPNSCLCEQSLKVCPKRVNGDRRAVVACIVRKPRHGGQDSPLEMFFILRAMDPNGSRWSGQVAFPGGHVEEGETDADAVRRECEEEVGFDLNRTCRFLGETRPRVVQRNGGNLVVCCHVYEMVKEENPVGQISEIGACGWTPVHVLLDDKHTEPLNWSGLMAGSEGNCNVSPSGTIFRLCSWFFKMRQKIFLL